MMICSCYHVPGTPGAADFITSTQFKHGIRKTENMIFPECHAHFLKVKCSRECFFQIGLWFTILSWLLLQFLVLLKMRLNT
jgi:hypothetical protein